MILVCPSCASTHHIARQLLGAKGRQVRCAQCRALWFQHLPEETSAGEECPLIAAEAQSTGAPAFSAEAHEWQPSHLAANENRPSGVRLRRRRDWRRLWSIAAALGLAAALMAGVAQREALVRLLPALHGLYAGIGLPVNLQGLDLRTIKSTLLDDGAQHVIAVTGEIANLRSVAQTVPSVRVALRGADGREVYNWTTPPPKPQLAAGETMVFRTRLADPPAGAREVVVQFAEIAAGAGQRAR